MQRIQQAQERWRAGNTDYASAVSVLTANDASITTSSDKGYYTLSTAATAGATSTAYTITATAVSGTSQASDSGCSALTITVSSGNVSYTPTSCWSK
jgi:type IV pilus assembly protein PilE